MATMVLLIGCPASGKTTYREKYCANAISICPDSFIGYSKEDPWTPTSVRLAWKQADQLLEESISGDKDIVFDATFTTPKRRKKYIQIAKQNDLEIHAVYCRIPLEVAIERNAKRDKYRQVPLTILEDMFNRLVPPSTEEGFDYVYSYDSLTGKTKREK